ncbi:MAG: hypothetical protein ACLR8U_13125 [Oscillospiraceae bacterium]
MYRWALAILSWCAHVAEGSRVRRGFASCWRSSKAAAWFSRRLSSGTSALDESGTNKLLTRCNERLSQKGTSWVESSVLYQVYRAVFTCGRNSRTFGWLFSGGMTAILLFAIGLYVLIDYVLRDILSIPVVSSVWDEALLLFCVLWIIWERKRPLPHRAEAQSARPSGSRLSHGLLRAAVCCLPVHVHPDRGFSRAHASTFSGSIS